MKQCDCGKCNPSNYKERVEKSIEYILKDGAFERRDGDVGRIPRRIVVYRDLLKILEGEE